MDPEFDSPSAVIKPPGTGRRSRGRGWKIELLVSALICVGLVALLLPAVRSGRESARRAQCTCNLCQIKLALHNYHSAHGCFPPAYAVDAGGKPLLSWRVLILPFMEQSTLYDRFHLDEPWDGPNNLKLLNPMPSVLACPSRPDRPTTSTSYVAITGPGTVFPGAGTTGIDDIKDGTSNTIMIGEVSDVAIPWTAPRDLDVRTMSFRVNDPRRPGLSSKHPGGANVVFADGATRFLRDSTSRSTLKALISLAGGEDVTADRALSGK